MYFAEDAWSPAMIEGCNSVIVGTGKISEYIIGVLGCGMKVVECRGHRPALHKSRLNY